ncbi:NTE family protein rssA [Methylovirgula sp. 4M-Z18]|nr:NTE family protein rssA [Methylovirgula sp. 4M-Z18]
MARGWAHIGVLQELEEQGFRPSVIAGTSIGAVAGGSYAAGRLDVLDDFARSMTKRRIFGMMDFSMGGSGLISGMKLRARLSQEFSGLRIEDLPIKYAAVATEVASGHEIWLRHGHLADAVSASYALPGIFDPVQLNGRWLVDGALVNPVPVTVCRALGATAVIAVNLNGDIALHGALIPSNESAPIEPELDLEDDEPAADKGGGIMGGIRSTTNYIRRKTLSRHFFRRDDGAPGIATVMFDSFNIMQDRITRSRLAGDPPDKLISCKVGRIGLFDFHRADELISAGREAVKRALPDLLELTGPHLP